MDFSLENMDFSRRLSDMTDTDSDEDVEQDAYMNVCYAAADRAVRIFTTWMTDPEAAATPDTFPTLSDPQDAEPESISAFALFRTQCDPFRDDLCVFSDHYHLLTSRTTLRHLFASRLLSGPKSEGNAEWIQDSGTWLLVGRQTVSSVTTGQVKWMFDTIRTGMRKMSYRPPPSSVLVDDLMMSDPIRSSCVIQLLIEREYEIRSLFHDTQII